MALVYPNNDPLGFMCAFYGCIMAGIVPVPIEVPLTRRDAGSQQIGFLLGKFVCKHKDCLFSFLTSRYSKRQQKMYSFSKGRPRNR